LCHQKIEIKTHTKTIGRDWIVSVGVGVGGGYKERPLLKKVMEKLVEYLIDKDIKRLGLWGDSSSFYELLYICDHTPNPVQGFLSSWQCS